MVFFRGSDIEHAALKYFVMPGRVQTKLFHDSTTYFNCANPPYIPAEAPVQTLKLYDSVPTGTGTRDISEHFCLIPERVVLVPE